MAELMTKRASPLGDARKDAQWDRMIKPTRYRAKADESRDLARSSAESNQSSDFRRLERKFKALADDGQSLADDYRDAAIGAERHQPSGEPLADEEEHILRYLGAALIMQWNTIPTKLQRELFDAAGSLGDVLRTVALRGQIARLLHNHKDEEKLPNILLNSRDKANA
jgi:hypothetical protein